MLHSLIYYSTDYFTIYTIPYKINNALEWTFLKLLCSKNCFVHFLNRKTKTLLGPLSIARVDCSITIDVESAF